MSKRKYRKWDTVKIGKFGPLSTFGKYENRQGKITKCLNEKVMGFWVYEVELHGFETEQFTEKYILPRHTSKVCPVCHETVSSFRHVGECQDCIALSYYEDE